MTRGGAGLTTRGQSFLTSGVMLLVCGFALGLGDLVRLGLLLLVLVLAALVVARRAPSGLDVARRVSPERLVAGDAAQVVIDVRNPGRRRTSTLVATEQVPHGLADQPRFLLPALDPGETRAVRYAVHPRVRGPVELGPLAVRVRDSFGLTTRTVLAGGSHTVLVLPRVHALDGRSLAAAGAGGDGANSHGVAATGAEDLSIREYRHGDELRRIHWRATAHTGELMVRQEERPSRRTAVVLLDSRASSHSGRDERSTFEWAVTFTASVVTHLEAAGFAVTLVCEENVDGARHGAVDDPLEVLARARTGDTATFERCVHAVDEVATTGAVVIAVLGTDPETGTRLAGTRHPSTRCLAALVARERDAAAHETSEDLTRHGWRVAIATPETDVAQAWAGIAGRAGVPA